MNDVPLHCLVVDDEVPARARMRRLLQQLDGVEVVGEAGDGLSALEQVASLKPEVLFLDIEMPGLDGLGVAASLPPDAPAVVFVTAYDAHALKAFEVAAADYIVKPVSKERLSSALERVKKKGRAGQSFAAALLPIQRMAVRCGAKLVVFDPEKVSAVLARDHYAAILVEGKELLADESLDVLARRFDAKRLLRIHRSALLNVAYLKELVHEGDRKYVAVLSEPSGLRVPVSRERLPELKAFLGV